MHVVTFTLSLVWCWRSLRTAVYEAYPSTRIDGPVNFVAKSRLYGRSLTWPCFPHGTVAFLVRSTTFYIGLLHLAFEPEYFWFRRITYLERTSRSSPPVTRDRNPFTHPRSEIMQKAYLIRVHMSHYPKK